MKAKHKSIVDFDRFKIAMTIKNNYREYIFGDYYNDWVSFCEKFLGYKFKWYRKLYYIFYYKLIRKNIKAKRNIMWLFKN